VTYRNSYHPRLRAEVNAMTMLGLIARDSGWLTVLPGVVVQDELRFESLVAVCQSHQLQERCYAITTLYRHRTDIVERMLTHSTQNPTSLESPMR
jgi:LysR family transcriptional activator of nhaA